MNPAVGIIVFPKTLHCVRPSVTSSATRAAPPLHSPCPSWLGTTARCAGSPRVSTRSASCPPARWTPPALLFLQMRCWTPGATTRGCWPICARRDHMFGGAGRWTASWGRGRRRFVFATSIVFRPTYCWLAVMLVAAALPPLVAMGCRTGWRQSRGFTLAWTGLGIGCGALVALDVVRCLDLYRSGELPGGVALVRLLARVWLGPFGAYTLKGAGVVGAVSVLLTLAAWSLCRAGKQGAGRQ